MQHFINSGISTFRKKFVLGKGYITLKLFIFILYDTVTRKADIIICYQFFRKYEN